MLRLLVYVNQRKVDEIHIQNTADLGSGLWEYTLRKPPLERVIIHKYSKGWKPLAIKALMLLEDHMDRPTYPQRKGGKGLSGVGRSSTRRKKDA